MNDPIQAFVDKWQQIEDGVISRAHMTDHDGFVKAFNSLIKDDSLLAQKASLVDDLRALRNVFSHRDRVRYLAELQAHVLSDLDEIHKLITNPPTVFETFRCDVYTASLNTPILEVMDTMTRHTYTHVPIVDNRNKVLGVFTYNSFFEWAHDVLKQHAGNHFEKECIRDIDRKYLLSPTVYFSSIKGELPAGEVSAVFRKAISSLRRLDCMLITEGGSKNEPILGIITPWDLYKVM